MSRLPFGLALTLAACACSRDGNEPERSTPAIVAPAIASKRYPEANYAIDQLKNVPWCIYYVSYEDGNLWRCSIDGSVRELVLKTKIDMKAPLLDISLSGNHAARGATPLFFLAGSPLSANTIIDYRTTDAPRLSQVRRITNSPGQPSRGDLSPQFDPNWQEFALQERVGTSGRYGRTYVTALSLRGKDRKPRRFDFEATANFLSQPLAIFESRYYVIYDYPNLILWDLVEDRKSLLARAFKFTLWPRNLQQKQRFRPIRTVTLDNKIYKWRVSNPSDIDAKPEYLAPPARPQPVEYFPPLHRPIRNLSGEPYCLYLIRSDDQNVWRYSLDGSRRELALRMEESKKPKYPYFRFSGYYELRNPMDLLLFNYPKSRSTIIDRHNSEKRTLEILRGQRVDVPYASWIEPRSSVWKITYSVAFDLSDNPSSLKQDALILTDTKGRIRKHLIRTSRVTRILGMFQSRYAVLWYEPNVILWDLSQDKKWQIASALDLRLWPRDLNRPERFEPKSIP